MWMLAEILLHHWIEVILLKKCQLDKAWKKAIPEIVVELKKGNKLKALEMSHQIDCEIKGLSKKLKRSKRNA